MRLTPGLSNFICTLAPFLYIVLIRCFKIILFDMPPNKLISNAAKQFDIYIIRVKHISDDAPLSCKLGCFLCGLGWEQTSAEPSRLPWKQVNFWGCGRLAQDVMNLHPCKAFRCVVLGTGSKISTAGTQTNILTALLIVCQRLVCCVNFQELQLCLKYIRL